MAQNKKAIGFIFITLILDITGLGLIIPVLPDLIKELIDGTVSHAAIYGGYLTATYAVMQFVFAPVLGGLSDQYGRRPVLLFSLFGFGLDYLFLFFAPTIGWLFVGRAIAGITGASITTASAYIADISTNEDRAKNFGMIGAAFGIGFIIGPAIGGLLGSFGTRIPFLVAAGLTLLNWLYGYFVLPESLPVKNRRPFDIKRANPLGSLLQLKKYPSLGGLIVAFFFIYIASHAIQSNWGFYGIEKFGWSEKMIGISLAFVGLLIAIVQGVLIRYINPKIGDEKSVYYGLGLYAFGMLGLAFASETWMVFAILIPYCVGGISGPALQSIITKNVAANEQGELQGALTSLISITTIIAPMLMTGLFSHFTRKDTSLYFPGMPFILASALMLTSVLIAFKTLEKNRVHKLS